MENEEGLRFRLRNLKYMSSQGDKKRVVIELDTHTDNALLLDEVLRMLQQGITIKTGDFKEELLGLMREENHRLTRELMTANLILDAYKKGVLPDLEGK